MIGIWFPITQGKFALVDRGIYPLVIQTKWQYNRTRGYVCGRRDGRRLTLHQFIIFLEQEEYIGSIDHWNRDKVDCRRENLRVGPQSHNLMNAAHHCDSASKYKGVSIDSKDRIFAQIKTSEKIWLGYHKTQEEAADAYDNAAIVFFGQYAKLNCSWLEGKCH